MSDTQKMQLNLYVPRSIRKKIDRLARDTRLKPSAVVEVAVESMYATKYGTPVQPITEAQPA